MSAGRTTLLLIAVMTAIIPCALGIAIFQLCEVAFEEQRPGSWKRSPARRG